jgi:hypothetical protein
LLLTLLFVAFRSAKPFPDCVPLATAIVTALGLVSAHILFDLKFPADRACLYFVPLLGVAWAIGLSEIRIRPIAAVHACIALVLIAQFCTQFQTSFFQFWTGESDNRLMAATLGRLTRGCPDASISMRGDPAYVPALEFYRKTVPLKALQPIDFVDSQALRGYDYYALLRPEAKDLRQAHLRVLQENSHGFVLAAAPGDAASPCTR